MEVLGKVKVINAEQQVSASFKKRELVFTSPFTSWRMNWFASSTIAFASKASNQALGLVYFLDLKHHGFYKDVVYP